MRLKLTLATFDEPSWHALFNAYVAVNKSHWHGPPFEAVRSVLERKGRYEFSVPAMGTWASRFVLAVDEGGFLHAGFEKNPALSHRMLERLDAMELAFEESVRRLA